MKAYRVLSFICLGLLAVITVFMILALFAGKPNSFFVFGGVWVGVVIVSFVVVKSFKNKYRKEEENDRASEN